MNIVIYSYHFFPQANAESYCATRFASSLARCGHNVTVVTMNWPMQVSQRNYDALVAKELKIVKVPFSSKKNSPLKALLWYGHKGRAAVDVKESVKAVKAALKLYDKPILMTRAHPVASCMVGLKTYKYAHKWVAHFSDPMPWRGYSNTIGHRILRRLEYNIVKSAFLKSDMISVTCQHACKFFKEAYGNAFDESKVMVNTHIGDYRMGGNLSIEVANNDRVLLHAGTIYPYRGGKVIQQVMESFNAENYKCKFVQIGIVDQSFVESLSRVENVEIHNTASLEQTLELHRKASALFIPDFELSTSYSPFLLSKFVYCVMNPQPIVAYSKLDSEMHDFAERFPDAGIFWAEFGNFESLKEAIKRAMDCDVSTIDRSALRKCFAEETVAENFIHTMEAL